MTFLLPTEQNQADVQAFYREMEAAGDACIGIGHYRDYPRWLLEMQNRHTGAHLPEGYVRENFYLCYEGDLLVGVFSLKFALTDYLLNFGGHIGYATRPSERNRGLATRMLEQGLDLAAGFGFDRILCVCDEDNLPSERVILKNAGVLEDKRYDPEEGVFVKRFWIALPKAGAASEAAGARDCSGT